MSAAQLIAFACLAAVVVPMLIVFGIRHIRDVMKGVR